MNSRSIILSLFSLLPRGRRFIRAFRDIQAGLTALRIEVGGLKAELAALRQEKGDGHTQQTSLSIGSDSNPDRITARELQILTAAHHPLLPADLQITETAIEVRGVAIAPDALFANMAFYFNGIPFDEVIYPVEDAGVSKRFSEIKGAAAFVARIDKAKVDVRTPLFRIDVSPTGAFVPARWRQAAWFGNPTQEQFPLPPRSNMRRVVGDDHAARFSMGGATIFKKIESYLGEMGKSWTDFQNILDWGCGAGRLTRNLIAHTSGCSIIGADVDANNIAWCRRNLPGGEFITLNLAPPTPFGDGAFDLVVGCSVVTHLTEPMLFAWLRELQRITAPGALLFLSFSGPVYFTHLGIPPALYRQVENEGFVDFARDGSLDGHIADDDYYRSTWLSRSYFTRTCGQYFDVIVILDGAAALQDFVVLRRRDTSGAAT